jgi:hypothetical protein
VIYEGRPYDELVALLYQRDGENDVWRQRWKEEQAQRLQLEQEREP